MNEKTTQASKPSKEENSIKELLKKNKQETEVIDTSLFDETLEEIRQILKNLEKDEFEKHDTIPEIKSTVSKIHLTENEHSDEKNKQIKNYDLIKRIEYLEKSIAYLNKSSLLSDKLEGKSSNEFEEHKIDRSLLSIDELHEFKEKEEIKKKNFFGFYSYSVLTILIFFMFYEILNLSKDWIVLEYPELGKNINYLFETVEMIKISIFNFFNFIEENI